nr:hypothetical protein [uncultured Actinotalea sp.]
MALDTTAATPERPSTDGATGRPTDPLTPGPAGPPAAARRRRGVRVAAGVALAVGAVAVWELGALHDDGPLLGGEEWGWTSCQSRPEPGLVDFTIGGVLATPTADVVVLGVRAVNPRNVVVRDGAALPFLGDRDGDGDETILGERAGYPPTDPTGADVVWAQGDPLVGTLLVRGAPTNLVWHAEVVDPSRDAAYDAVQVEYRSGHRRHVAVVEHRWSVPGGADPQACATR